MKDVFIHSDLGELSKVEKHLNYDERRMLDLVHQTLNQTSNHVQEYDNIEDLFRIYNKTLAKRTTDVFQESLDKSMKAYKDDEKLMKSVLELKEGEGDSFIILPVASNSHQFSTVIRKSLNHYSFTVVNKGERPYNNQFITYEIKPDQCSKVLKILRGAMGKVPTSSIYDVFRSNSIKTTRLKLYSSEQKTGNCFIKEPENAIKYAFATRKFRPKDLDELENNVKGFSSKWDHLTDHIHRSFVGIIKEEYPKISKVLNIRYENYARNKKFRQLIFGEEKKDCDYALKKAFDPEGIYSRLEPRHRVMNMMAFLNIDSLNSCSGILRDFVMKTQGEKYQKEFYNALYLSTGLFSAGLVLRFGPDKLDNMLENSKNKFPFLTGQLKYEYGSRMFWTGLSAAEVGERKKNRYLEVSEKLYPNNHHLYAFQGALNGEEDRKEKLEQSLKDFNKALSLKPNYANCMYMRGVVYEKLGNEQKAQEDFEKVKKMTPKQFEKWGNMTLQEVFISYFKEISVVRDLRGRMIANEAHPKNPFFPSLGFSLG
jgi:tetratricopeptide (TPR) repeat protein